MNDSTKNDASSNYQESKLYSDLVNIIFDCYPQIKGAHCASIVYGVMAYIAENNTDKKT